MTHIIDIVKNDATYQKLLVLQTNRNKRYKYGEFIIEGVRNINEAIRGGWEILSLIYSGDKALSTWALGIISENGAVHYRLADHLMEGLSRKEDASELMAIIRMRPDSAFLPHKKTNPMIALFDRPSNKGNLGTLFRSCDALGVDGLVITGHAVDAYDPDVITSSMGSFFHIPFSRLSDNRDIELFVSRFKTDYPSVKVIGTTAHQQTRLSDIDLTTPVIFLIGNETDGLNRHLAGLCDIMATIPMSADSSASSLNVSCAATVFFYEANRQRALR